MAQGSSDSHQPQEEGAQSYGHRFAQKASRMANSQGLTTAGQKRPTTEEAEAEVKATSKRPRQSDVSSSPKKGKGKEKASLGRKRRKGFTNHGDKDQIGHDCPFQLHCEPGQQLDRQIRGLI
jgi:hypothetical protein